MANTKLPSRLLDTSAVPALNVTGDLTVDTTTLKVDSTNNRVGIGTSSPDQLLSVKGRISSDLNDDYYGAWLDGNSAASQDNFLGLGPWHNNAGYIKFFQSSSPDRLSIYTTNTGDHVTLQEAGGKVGIGTTTPVTTFDVKNSGDSAYTGGILIRTGTSTSEATSLYHDNNSATTTVLANRYDNAGAAIKLILKASSSSPVTALTALGSGNVGIGTTTPNRTLSVSTGLAKTSTTTAYPFAIQSNESSGQALLSIHATGGASASDRKWFIQAEESGVANAGQIHLNHYGGTVHSPQGIVFGTETTAAYTLDDYEEGTWTPALYTYGGVTTTSSSMYGIYTKIGNICHIHCKIAATLSSLPGQNWVITGLPFSGLNTNDANQRAIFAIGGDVLNTGGNTPKAHFRIASNELHGIYFNASSNTAYWSYAHMDSSTFELNVHGFYTTT